MKIHDNLERNTGNTIGEMETLNKNSKIIGYKLIYPQYEQVAIKALNLPNKIAHNPFILAGMIGYYLPKIKELGIMDWFEPVCEEDLIRQNENQKLLDEAKLRYPSGVKFYPVHLERSSKTYNFDKCVSNGKFTIKPNGSIWVDVAHDFKSEATPVVYNASGTGTWAEINNENIIEMEKTIKLSLNKAREIYGKNPEMDELLLANFSKEELTKKDLPKEFNKLGLIGGYYIHSGSSIVEKLTRKINTLTDSNTYHIFATKEQARSARAMAQLSQLIAAYNDGWIANYQDSNQIKFQIICDSNKIIPNWGTTQNEFLAFKSAEIRDEFLRNFKPLVREYFMID